VTLLRTHVPELSAVDADRVAEAVGDLPLVLDQAGSLLADAQLDVDSYLNLIAHRTYDLLSQDTGGGTYPTSAAASWSVAFDRLATDDPVALDLLTLIAWCGPEPVPVTLVIDNTDSQPAPLRQLTDPLVRARVIGILHRRGMATVAPHSIKLHRIPAALLRARTADSVVKSARDTCRWADAVIAVLATAFPDDGDEPSTWQQCGKLLPHVLAAKERASGVGPAGETAATLLTNAGIYLKARGELDLAHAALTEAYELRKRLLGDDHPDVAATLAHLGTVLRRRGDPHTARLKFKEALRILNRAPDRDQLIRAFTLMHYGIVLRDVGLLNKDIGMLNAARSALEQATTIHRSMLEIDQKPEPDRRGYAKAMTYYGAILEKMGRSSGARDVLAEALEINKSTLGLEHPDTAVTMAHLGSVLRDLGDLPGALAAHENALDIRRKVFGHRHPEVAYALRDLGRTRLAMGDLENAHNHIRDSVEVFTQVNGPDHPETIATIQDRDSVLHRIAARAGDRPTPN
jgi:tetratricopeptide (TPR) repeat protein